MGLLKKIKKIAKKSVNLYGSAMTGGMVDNFSDIATGAAKSTVLGKLLTKDKGGGEVDPVTGETIMPLPDDEEMAAAAARKFQRRFGTRGRTGTALSSATGGTSTLG